VRGSVEGGSGVKYPNTVLDTVQGVAIRRRGVKPPDSTDKYRRENNVFPRSYARWIPGIYLHPLGGYTPPFDMSTYPLGRTH